MSIDFFSVSFFPLKAKDRSEKHHYLKEGGQWKWRGTCREHMMNANGVELP